MRPVGESPPVHYSTVQYSTVKYSKIKCSTSTGAMMINIGQVLNTVTETNNYKSELWCLVKGNLCPRGKCKVVYQFFPILFAGFRSGLR